MVETAARAQIVDPPETLPLLAPHPLFGQSERMRQVLQLVGKVASKQVDVLLLGESGTGKELVAKALHLSSTRAQQPFVPFNVAAIAPELVEAELFGAERGAYTGSVETRVGRFELCGSGTLFLDEIGSTPLDTQAKLLRVLQEREFERVGGSRVLPFAARIIAATNVDLELAVNERRFREDLYYRLNVFPIRIPPLRERKEDIRALAKHFCEEEGRALRGVSMSLDDGALALLEEQRWPGNVRELKNTLSRAMILTTHPQISAHDLMPLLRAKVDPTVRTVKTTETVAPQKLPDFMALPLEEIVQRRLAPFVAKFCEGPTGDLHQLVLAQMERALFRLVLERTRGNQIKAAEILGLNRNTLRKKLRELGISAK